MTKIEELRGAVAADPELGALATGDVLDGMTFPPLRWAVEAVLPQGLGLLIAPPKAGKSWATLDIALAVASGTRALGAAETGRARPVLLMALEDSPQRLQKRIRTLRPDEQIPPLLTYPQDPINPMAVPAIVERWLDYYGHLDPLVIIDTLGKVQTPPIGNEGPYGRDYRIVGGYKTMADKHPGTSVLLVHHTNTNGATDDWMNGTSGTNGINGAADFTIFLDRKRNSVNATLRGTGRDMPDYEYALDFDNGAWTLAGGSLPGAVHEAETRKVAADMSDDMRAVLELVNATGTGVRSADVEEALGFDGEKSRKYLGRLHARGYIEKPVAGLYTPVPTVPVSHIEEVVRDTGTAGTAPMSPLAKKKAA